MVQRLLVICVAALFAVMPVSWDPSSNALAQTECETSAPSDAQQFSGETSTVTDPFVVESGVLKVTATHNGTGNFIVIPLTEDGRMVSVFNEIGSFSGEASMAIDPGTTLILDIQADGPWELSIESAF